MSCSAFYKNKAFTHTPKIWVCGFTLVELMVVMAIAMIITTAVVIRQGMWDDRLAVNTQAYEMTMMIREAQIYSLGVRKDSVGSGGDKFNIGYGVYIASTNTNGYVFFADRNANKKYDAGEEVETKTFSRGVIMEKFCGTGPGVGNEFRCSNESGNLDTVHIFFLRPDPNANISILNGGANQSGSVNPPVTIYLRSPKGNTASLKIQSNGQISVMQ